MKEIIYQFQTRGMYTTQQSTLFGEDAQLKLVMEPHDFSIAVGDEVLRSTASGAYTVLVSRDGGATFYDGEGNPLATAEPTTADYHQVQLNWTPECLAVQFGHEETVDYYPNCDGEHDRWGTQWVAQRTVTLNQKDNTVTIQ